MAVKKTGFASTQTVGGETVPVYTTERTTGTSTIGKMMNAAIAQLTQSKIKGVGGAVGTYDDQIIGEACHSIFNGSHTANFYGCSLGSDFFQRIGVLMP